MYNYVPWTSTEMEDSFFFFHWHYSPLWALACRTMSFNFFLSATNSLHLLTPSTWRSLSTSSFHPFLGLLLLLIPSGSWEKIFLGILDGRFMLSRTRQLWNTSSENWDQIQQYFTPFPWLRRTVITINIPTTRIAYTVLLFSEVKYSDTYVFCVFGVWWELCNHIC